MHLSRTKTRSRLISWQIILAIFIFILAVVYVMQINNQAEYGFAIRNLEQSKKDLTNEINDLTWQASSGRSLARIEQRAGAMNLARPESVTFLQAGLSSVALTDAPLQ